MANIDSKKVKNQARLKKIIGCLNRARDYFPIYALRKKLNLPIGSGVVEKPAACLPPGGKNAPALAGAKRQGGPARPGRRCLRPGEWLYR